MKKTKWLYAAIPLFVCGLVVAVFPQVDELAYEHEVSGLKDAYVAYADKGAAKDEEDLLYDRLRRENETLYQTGQAGLTDAFSYEQPAVDLSAYGIEDNCIGFVSIPCIDMELPIYLGANTENMAKGAVHLTQTSYPIGGENTNCVIAAHRGTSLVMFRNIHKIEIGDEVTITNFRGPLTYRATEIRIIDPSDVDAIRIQPGRDLLTLISCNPLGHNYERYVVYCERV
ncbi:MAG: class C sortase [Clostridiales Family XIII bacterium]|jgi:sortase A|nr:class C sortase [Clostridiales Family XIII bacterium]